MAGYGALSLLLALVVAVVSAHPSAAAGTRFRAGIAAPTVNMLPLWLARDAGFFQAQGLDVEIVVTDGGSRGLAEVGAGRLDEMTVGLSSVLDANAKGGNYRLVASGANTLSLAFFGRADVRDAAALKGGTVGISTPGSESDTAARFALQRLGLQPQETILVPLGGTEARLDALKSRRIAASALNAPVNFMAERAGLPKLADLADDVPWLFTGYVFRRDAIAMNRERVKAFLRGLVEGIALGRADAGRAKAVLAREFPGLDPAIVQATYDDFRRRVPRDAAPSRQAAETMIRELPKLGAVVGSKAVADHVDMSLIADLKREGFLDAMKTKYGAE